MDHIQARLIPPEGQPPMDIRLDSRSQPSGWTAPALMTLLHLVLWLPSLVTFLVAGQRFKMIFADFQMKLPLATEVALSVSDLLAAWAWFLPVPILTLLAGDFLILYWLWRQDGTRPLAWTWFVLLILLSMGSLFWAWTALFQPLLTMMEGLSK